MYIDSILWLSTWPLLIIASYFLVRWALKVIGRKSEGEKE